MMYTEAVISLYRYIWMSCKGRMSIKKNMLTTL